MSSSDLIDVAASVLHTHTVQDRVFGDVASALLTRTGDIFTGVSVDTPGWGLCAERSAIAAMVTARQYRIARIVAVWRDQTSRRLYALPPCGICREFMRGVDPANLDCQVILGREESTSLATLLPLSRWPQPLEYPIPHTF